MRKSALLLLALLVIPSNIDVKNLNSKSSIDVTYDIHPIVHDIDYGDELVKLPKKIQLNLSSEIDNYTKKEAYDVLSLKNVRASTKADYADFELRLSVNQDSQNEHFNKLDAYTLEITNEYISIVGKDDRSCFYGLQSLREIFNQSDDEIRELTISDYSNSQYRGVIEGLYGVTYNNFEIKDMIEFMSYYKANTFFYGPRHDAYFRTAWREMLPDDEVVMLKEIADYSKERKVDFYFGCNPVETKSMSMSNYNEDIKIFFARFEQAYNVGIRNFFISCDDVDGASVDVELQIRFMNDLVAWTEEKGDCGRVVLTPSCYCGSSDEVLGVNSGYLDKLNGRLSDKIDVFWTGKMITSSISTGDFDTFYRLVGRKPIFWLNWPVNDYAPTKLIMSKGEMLDVTYEDEDAPFLGVISNPQILPYPSNLAIYQCLDYAWNYRDFNLNNVYNSSFERMEKNEPLALKKVCSYLANANKYLENRYFEESPELKVLINEYNRLKENGSSLVEIKKLIVKELNSTMTAVDKLINNAENRNLIKQLMPYILAVKDTCVATIEYLNLEDLVKTGTTDQVIESLNKATEAYNHIKENKSVVLDYVKCNEDPLPVDVCNAVLTPFLNELIESVDYEARLISGLPTGIIYRGFNGIYSGTFDDMFDNDESTYLWLDGDCVNKSYLQIDLEEVTEITSLKVVYRDKHGESCYFPNVEISNDGRTYTNIANVNSNLLELDLRDNPVETRFIRLGNFTGRTMPFWVSIAEIDMNYIPMDEVKVTYSGIDGIYSGSTSDMFDGNPSTYCWFNDYPQKDAYIQVDYRKEIEVENLTVLFKNMYNGDPCHMTSIEYSTDGVNFTKLGKITSNSFVMTFDTPIKLRYLRLTNDTGDKWGIWVSVSEIIINQDIPNIEYSGFNGIYSGSVNDMIDNDDSTYLWFSSGAENNGYVLFSYDEVQTASKFNVLFFNGQVGENQPGLTNCYLSCLEVSMDGINWTVLETGNDDNNINVTLDEEVSFKYLRLRNDSGYTTPHWVAIANVSFN